SRRLAASTPALRIVIALSSFHSRRASNTACLNFRRSARYAFRRLLASGAAASSRWIARQPRFGGRYCRYRSPVQVPSVRFGGEPNRRNEGLVYDDLPRRLGDETKVTRVIPHGPPDPVYLERGTDVGNPPHSIAGSRDASIDAELVTHHANIPLLRPRGDLLNLSA